MKVFFAFIFMYFNFFFFIYLTRLRFIETLFAVFGASGNDSQLVTIVCAEM